ncbi:MAG TPA: sulfatase-like hydrolase/transferase, partial [Terriglobales bacterium]
MKWDGKLGLTLATVVALFSTMGAPGAEAQAKQPNVVFILVDNVGWGSFGVYGGTTPTPRIDKLANEGIRFNNYNVEVQCTPSRSAIHTGRYSVRSGTYTVPLPGQGLSGMSPWEYTIAKLFSDAGYATALYGKWHLGDVQGRLPTDQGYDEWWGIKNSWDEAGYTAWPLFKESGVPVPMIWEGKKGEESKPVMPLDLKVRPIVDEKYIIPKTVDFIKRNAAAKKPFFVYVGYSEMHPPAMANPNFANKSPERSGVFADIIAEMDYRVGQVLDAVKEAGRREQHDLHLEQRQRGRRGHTTNRAGFERTVARRFLQHAVRGKHAGACHDSLARQGPGRCRHTGDACGGGLAADAGRDGRCVESGPQGPAHRWHRRFGV